VRKRRAAGRDVDVKVEEEVVVTSATETLA
jgi:hypothetical protein